MFCCRAALKYEKNDINFECFGLQLVWVIDLMWVCIKAKNWFQGKHQNMILSIKYLVLNYLIFIKTL